MENATIIDNFKRADAILKDAIDTTAGKFFRVRTGRGGEFHYPVILFFNHEDCEDDHHVHISDMAGVVEIEVSETGLEWVGFPNSNITLGDPDGYPRPNISGNYEFFRVNFTQVVELASATHFKFLIGCNKRA